MTNEELLSQGWTLYNAATDTAPTGVLTNVIRADGGEVAQAAFSVLKWGLMDRGTAGCEIVAYKVSVDHDDLKSVITGMHDAVVEQQPIPTSREGQIVMACASLLNSMTIMYNDLAVTYLGADFEPLSNESPQEMLALAEDCDFLVDKNHELENLYTTTLQQAEAIMKSSKITPEMIDTICQSMAVNAYTEHALLATEDHAKVWNTAVAMMSNRLMDATGPIKDGENYADHLNNTIAEMAKTIDTLRTSADLDHAALINTNDAISEADSTIEELENKIDSLRTDLSLNIKQNARIEKECTNYRTAISEHTMAIKAMEAEVRAHIVNVTEMKQQVAKMQNTIESLEDQ